jgi:tetratricopeptide (TPR) repeat protein
MRIAVTRTDHQPWKSLLLLFLLGLGGCAQTLSTGTAVGDIEAPVDPPVPIEKQQAESNKQPAQAVVPAEEAAPQMDQSVSPYVRFVPPLPRDVVARFDHAMALLMRGDQEQAKQILLILEKQCASCSGVFFNLGLIYRDAGEFDSARRYLQKATQVNGDNLQAWNELAILHRQAGEFEAAENCYQQALQRWPSYPAAHLNLAILYELYMGRLSESLAHYMHYQELTENDESVDPGERRKLQGWIALLERQLQRSSGAEKNITEQKIMHPVGGVR